MYSTCLYCHRSLGHNEAIEHFTVGRRLAFDSAKGRLWAVCRTCQRWNLTPLEERWEAVEECERSFANQRLRAQTGNIGLTRLKEGTELVRIGAPLRPEYAAWRYGRMFGQRRRRRAMVLSGGALVAGAGAMALLPAMPTILLLAVAVGGMSVGIPALLFVPILALRGHVSTTRVMGADEKALRLVGADIEQARINVGATPDAWSLFIRHSYGHETLVGDRARRALGAILARANRAGASEGTVRDATTMITSTGSADTVVNVVAAEARSLRGNFEERLAKFQRGANLAPRDATVPLTWEQLRETNLLKEPINRGSLTRLPAVHRLALEMSLHEETEQHALDNELAILETAWREAEEIAAIADTMFVPRSTTDFIDKHSSSGGR